MKNLKKVVLTSLLVIGVSSSIGSPVLAYSNSIGNKVSSSPIMVSKIDVNDIKNVMVGKKIILKDGGVLTRISEKEYLRGKAKELGVPFEYVYKMKHSNNAYINVSDTGREEYYDYEKVFTYSKNSDFKARMEATLTLYVNGSFREFTKVDSLTSRRDSGLYENEWIQTASFHDIYPDRVKLNTQGYFSVTVSKSFGESIDLPGFSVDGSTGINMIYLSDTMKMRAVLDQPDINRY